MLLHTVSPFHPRGLSFHCLKQNLLNPRDSVLASSSPCLSFRPLLTLPLVSSTSHDRLLCRRTSTSTAVLTSRSPLDQTKYRMQVMSGRQNMMRTLVLFVSRDGIFSLWSGISASILRQSTYSTARFGLYQYFAQEAKTRSETSKLSLAGEATCAAMSGGLAGLIGNPTEVALVRMCADGAKSANQRFGYNNCFDALLRICREEGLRTFTRGVGPKRRQKCSHEHWPDCNIFCSKDQIA